MPRIPQYEATGEFRPTNLGLNAFDTMGRRVAGQYDAAASDMTQAGRTAAQMRGMIGRWPWNVLQVRGRMADRIAKEAAAANKSVSGGKAGGFTTLGGANGRGRSDPWARRMPDLAALNQTSEGMGRLGRMLGGGDRGNSGGLSGRDESFGGDGVSSDRDGYSARELAIRDRQAQLDDLAAAKRWDKYEENLRNYNKDLEKNAQAASPYGTYSNTNDPSSPYYTNYGPAYADPSSSLYEPPSTTGEYGGPTTSVPDTSGYGGGGASGWTTFTTPTLPDTVY